MTAQKTGILEIPRLCEIKSHTLSGPLRHLAPALCHTCKAMSQDKKLDKGAGKHYVISYRRMENLLQGSCVSNTLI